MDIIVVKEDTGHITVVDQETNLPITISSEEYSVTDVAKPVQVTSVDGEKFVYSDGDQPIGVSEKVEKIAPQFKEVLTIIQQVPTEEDVAYTEEIDFVGDDTVYRGWAGPGTTTDLPLWRVRRTRFIGEDGDVVHDWADGNAAFDNIWDDRLTFTYS